MKITALDRNAVLGNSFLHGVAPESKMAAAGFLLPAAIAAVRLEYLAGLFLILSLLLLFTGTGGRHQAPFLVYPLVFGFLFGRVLLGYTGAVLVRIGSADFLRTPGGQVDMCVAQRSPGSTLKPFIYGLALEQNRLYPTEMLLDDTLDFGNYSPVNFDKNFNGLITSLNMIAEKYGFPIIVSTHPRTRKRIELLVTNHQSPVTSHQSPITSHQSPITNHQSPITSHQSPVTNHQSPVTSYHLAFIHNT